jgi:hypothetical protein
MQGQEVWLALDRVLRKRYGRGSFSTLEKGRKG